MFCSYIVPERHDDTSARFAHSKNHSAAEDWQKAMQYLNFTLTVLQAGVGMIVLHSLNASLLHGGWSTGSARGFLTIVMNTPTWRKVWPWGIMPLLPSQYQLQHFSTSHHQPETRTSKNKDGKSLLLQTNWAAQNSWAAIQLQHCISSPWVSLILHFIFPLASALRQKRRCYFSIGRSGGGTSIPLWLSGSSPQRCCIIPHYIIACGLPSLVFRCARHWHLQHVGVDIAGH